MCWHDSLAGFRLLVSLQVHEQRDKACDDARRILLGLQEATHSLDESALTKAERERADNAKRKLRPPPVPPKLPDARPGAHGDAEDAFQRKYQEYQEAEVQLVTGKSALDAGMYAAAEKQFRSAELVFGRYMDSKKLLEVRRPSCECV